LAGLALSLPSSNVVAGTKAPAGDKVADMATAKAPIRMTDSEMDKVVAGSTTKFAGNHPPGHNLVWTSGGTDGTGQLIGGSTCVFYNGSGKVSGKPCP
jgi:hypothetical protein